MWFGGLHMGTEGAQDLPYWGSDLFFPALLKYHSYAINYTYIEGVQFGVF